MTEEITKKIKFKKVVTAFSSYDVKLHPIYFVKIEYFRLLKLII